MSGQRSTLRPTSGDAARGGALSVRAVDLLRNSVFRGPTTVASRPRSEINLQWMIHLRWAAIAGQLITVLVVRFVLEVEIHLAALLGVIGLEFGTNAYLLLLLRKLATQRHSGIEGTFTGAAATRRLRALQLGVTLLDTTLLATLLELSGGVTNPFCAFLIIHVALGAVLLPLRHSLVAAGGVAVALVLLKLVRTDVPELTSSVHLREWGTVVAVSLTSLLSVIFVSRVNSALVQRSELLEQERERRERRRHLEALGTLAAGAAHELGTPLSTIAIIAKELERRLEREGANEDDLADARLIRDEVARCRRILGRMSTEAGDGPGEEIVGTSLPDLGRQVLGEMAGASAVVLTVEGGDEPVDLPREGLATSVRALVQNALDASPPGVKVDLRLLRTDEALTISVIDEGEGMDSQQIERALEPFFTTKEVGRGMGLGLYLASSFIESLGGELLIESSRGRGSTVSIRIPLGRGGVGTWAPASLAEEPNWLPDKPLGPIPEVRDL